MVPKGRQRQCGRVDKVDSARKCAAGPQRHRKRRSWARRPAHQKKPERSGKQRQRSVDGPLYGALDLGTNNCRLLIAAPGKGGFEVVDAFSRIVRLGEGVSQTGRLSEAAIGRTISALRVCANKLKWWNVTRNRLIATEACRMAENGRAFLDRVRDEVGLDLEMADRATEAQLAVAGASPLVCPDACKVLIFDIGGGSTELMWLDITDGKQEIQAWTSIPAGVVTVAEKFGGVFVDDQVFAAMRESVRPLMEQFHNQTRQICDGGAGPCHLLGTSGTVTTLCGIHLNLPRYDRSQVDGCWLDGNDVGAVTRELLAMSHEERASSPCIGKQRADLVMAGCAIFEEIRRLWPSDRIRVADRGLREGILASMMKEDGVYGRTP
ncbi:MAG TPA: Ppx/GppA family phosphatase [Rhizobiales bacterium]|nr:Ppx/GppA family phosphatase [Hyphomicrobiales bacterium]